MSVLTDVQVILNDTGGTRWTNLAAYEEAAIRAIKRVRPDYFLATAGTLMGDVTLPDECNQVIMDYMLARAFQEDSSDVSNMNRANMHMSLYENGLRKLSQ